MKLYINGHLLDLEPGQVIAQTKQVNDLNSLENRQANYTNKFKVPKTAGNVRAMQFLSLQGNNAAIPYTKNECYLYSDTGECFVYKGWAVVTDGGDSYEVVVYDGIIDLFKAIENLSLSSLNLDALTHEKNVATIKASSENEMPYRYILADYNGDTGNTSSGEVNIDYLVPSVNVAWLWHKIFEKYNFSYAGSVFDSFNFTQLWMTYPKGLPASQNDLNIFSSNKFAIYSPLNGTRMQVFPFQYIQTSIFDTNNLERDPFMYNLKVKESGTYKITIKGKLHTDNDTVKLKLKLGKNIQYPARLNSSAIAIYTFPEDVIMDEDFEVTTSLSLNAMDSICVYVQTSGTQTFRFAGQPEDTTLEIKLAKVEPSIINFAEAFSDFSIRDFLTEVVHRFGLTMFKNKYERGYTFLTLQEQLQTNQTVNWSSKFIKKTSESYAYGNYAQRNWFRYSYNDKESNYNDGAIDVDNVNLPDSRDVIKSKIYSPEFTPVTYLNRPGKVYKLWEKEIKENPAENESPVTYKALDKRYYFLKSLPYPHSLVLKSNVLVEQALTTVSFVESFYKLHFDDIKQDYYSLLNQILDKSIIITAELFLNDLDIAGFDFKKLYYIEQLSNYFIVNKINNYIPGKPVKVELVRVRYSMAD